MAIMAAAILLIPVGISAFQQQHASAFGFVETQQIGEFKKLTGEFVQNVINRQQSPNSDNVEQFRILTAQFERDVINAILNDRLSLIPGLVSQYNPIVTIPELPFQDGSVEGYFQRYSGYFANHVSKRF